MYEYRIEGGFPIKGTIKASGNKNAALPCIAASLLTSEKVILRNIPEIEDTGVMLLILQSFGAKVEKLSENAWEINASEISRNDIPPELSKKIRASILFAGPLLARTGKAIMPPPGGDVIGRRRLDTHFLALEELLLPQKMLLWRLFLRKVQQKLQMRLASLMFRIYAIC